MNIDAFSRLYDNKLYGFEKNWELTKFYLKSWQHLLNTKLENDGYLLLNDVYTAIGFPRTNIGGRIGWACSNNEHGSIDFGYEKYPENVIYDDNGDFIGVWLKFNPMGEVDIDRRVIAEGYIKFDADQIEEDHYTNDIPSYDYPEQWSLEDLEYEIFKIHASLPLLSSTIYDDALKELRKLEHARDIKLSVNKIKEFRQQLIDGGMSESAADNTLSEIIIALTIKDAEKGGKTNVSF